MSHQPSENSAGTPKTEIVPFQRVPENIQLQTTQKVGGIQNWVRGKAKTIGAYVGIVTASVLGGQVAAKYVNKKARPVVEAVEDAATIEVCQGNFDELKKEWLSQIENGQGTVMGKILDAGPVKTVIKDMINMMVDMLNTLQGKLCKIPEAVQDATKFTAAAARETTRALAMLVIFLALNALYKKIRKDLPRKLQDAADNNAAIADANAKAIQEAFRNMAMTSNANMETFVAELGNLTTRIDALAAENAQFKAILQGNTSTGRDLTQAIPQEDLSRLLAEELEEAAGVIAPTAVQVPDKKESKS